MTKLDKIRQAMMGDAADSYDIGLKSLGVLRLSIKRAMENAKGKLLVEHYTREIGTPITEDRWNELESYADALVDHINLCHNELDNKQVGIIMDKIAEVKKTL